MITETKIYKFFELTCAIIVCIIIFLTFMAYCIGSYLKNLIKDLYRYRKKKKNNEVPKM